jgi:hypothetical protein
MTNGKDAPEYHPMLCFADDYRVWDGEFSSIKETDVLHISRQMRRWSAFQEAMAAIGGQT